MELQKYKNMFVDYRLKQFRTIPKDYGLIEFIEFDSEKGDEILCEMIKDNLLDYKKYDI